jgi:transmembrane 9 superfamily protein 2/4
MHQHAGAAILSYMLPMCSCCRCCTAGILPFGTMFIELYFAMTSLWLGYFYYLFGFVFLIGLLTIVINCEIAVLCTYVQLCAEDYTWW